MKLDLLGDRQRTHYCGELRKCHAGQTVFLAGWVDRRRDLGNLIFLDLRDHTGVAQVVCRPEVNAAAHDKAEQVRSEYVVGVQGEVVERSKETVNPEIATGEWLVELRRESLLGRFLDELGLADYDALWRWSVDDLEGFWAAVWASL